LGVHEGEAQLFVNLVPQDDPDSYENGVRYDAGTRWQDASDTDWDTVENKDITDQATLTREAETLADELGDSNIEAEATTPNLNLELGDTVQVVKPDAEIDRAMRIHRIKEVVTGSTKTLKLLLSTRTRARVDENDDLRAIRQFNKGFQGSSVAVNGGPVIQAIDNGDPVTIPFRYPDLEFENAAELQVRGLEYRVDSQPKSHDHDVTINIPDHDHSVTVNIPSHNHSYTIESPDHIHDLSGDGFATTETQETSANDGTDHTHIYGVYQDVATQQTISNTTDSGGSEVLSETTDDGGAFITTETTDTETGLEAGIFGTNDTPSNVEVYINNNLFDSNIGSGTFQTTVDISDELTKDAWNTITIRSDSLGRIQASPFIEGYAQIGQQ
jgi:hypothetical protein